MDLNTWITAMLKAQATVYTAQGLKSWPRLSPRDVVQVLKLLQQKTAKNPTSTLQQDLSQK
jgi:hypothetical protein